MLRNIHKGLLAPIWFGMMLGSTAMAQYAIPTSVISGGASNMSGTSYAIMGSVGQPVIGAFSNTSYADSAGFWYTAGRASAASVKEAPMTLPKSFSLAQNYPNPFNPTTEIRFEVPRAARVAIKIYNIQGQFVETLADQEFSVGTHSISWSADRHASGLYLISMSAPGFSVVRRALLLK